MPEANLSVPSPRDIDLADPVLQYRRVWRAARLCMLYPIFFVAAVALFTIGNWRTGVPSGTMITSGVELGVAFGVIAFHILTYFSAGSYRMWRCVFAIILAAVSTWFMFFKAWLHAFELVSRELPADIGSPLLLGLNLFVAPVVLLVACYAVYRLRCSSQHLGGASGFELNRLFRKAVRRRRQSYSSIELRRLLYVPAGILVYVLSAALLFLLLLFVNAQLFPAALDFQFGELAEEALARKQKNPVQFFFSDVSVIVYFLMCTALGFLIYELVRRLMQRSARKLFQSGTYAPIVFLRSFQDENVRVAPISYFRRLFRLRPRLEAVVIRVIEKMGPPIAIGLPGERLPPLGALRAYYGDDEWQSAFEDWIQRSYLIVTMAGTTPWSLWELNHLLANNYAGKLVLVIPPDAKGGDGREKLQAVAQGIGQSAWHAEFARIDPVGLKAVVFANDGKVQCVRSAAHRQVDFELSVRTAITLVEALNDTIAKAPDAVLATPTVTGRPTA